MNATAALSRLTRLGVSTFRTADAAAALGVSVAAASVTLSRLGHAGLIRRVRSGLWWIGEGLAPLRLPELLTAPLPSYVSLLSALSIHGMIEQIPQLTYAVSLARTERIKTSVGVVSIHHVSPELFGGFMTLPNEVKVASPEKALFDLAYLSGGRSRRFAALPELELSQRFSRKELERWLEKITAARSRTMTRQRLETWLS